VRIERERAKRGFRASLAVAAAGVALSGSACHGTRPSNLGATNGFLAPCPDSPNCVSDRDTDPEHKIAPLTYTGSRADAMTKLASVVRSTTRAEIVSQTDDYLDAEYTSLIWRFVDDVEFSFDPDGKTIHVRSASRVGKGDLGVNRRRIEDIRVKFQGP